jgi:DUF1680 family protein
MTLGAKARRYISEAVKEFGSVKERVDWEEWDRDTADGQLSKAIEAVALKAVSAKSVALGKRIDALPEENEDALADLGNELGYLQSLIRALKGERVAA